MAGGRIDSRYRTVQGRIGIRKMTDRGTSTLTDEPVGRRQVLARWCQRSGLLPMVRSLSELVSRHDLRVLAYHRVLESIEPANFSFDPDLVSASAETFRRQMAHVRRRYTPMRFDEVLEHIDRGRDLPKGAVLVTFDDGYDDNHRVAFPILGEFGMSAMFFVSTGYIDSGKPYAFDWLVHMVCVSTAERLQAPELGLDWVLGTTLAERRAQAAELLHRLKALDADDQEAFILRLERSWGLERVASTPQCRPMNWDQLREMHSAGMEIGSHGVAHCMLAKLPRQRMVAEVEESKRMLERELGAPAIALSYPVGGPDSYDAETIEVVRAAGYRVACSYIGGAAAAVGAGMYALPRLQVERQMDQAWFEAMLATPRLFAYAPKQRAR